MVPSELALETVVFHLHRNSPNRGELPSMAQRHENYMVYTEASVSLAEEQLFKGLEEWENEMK